MDTTKTPIKRPVALLEMLLILPAALFMAALVVRQLQPLLAAPAQAAQAIVSWYAGRMWSLWVLLIALPLTVLVTGSAALWHGWREDAGFRQAARRPLLAIRSHGTAASVAATTLGAGVVLSIVALHMMAN